MSPSKPETQLSIPKIMTDESSNKSKFMYSVDINTDSQANSKPSDKTGSKQKEFAIFKNTLSKPKQSKTIDHEEPPKNSQCTSSMRSISPGTGANLVSKTLTSSTRVGSAANTINAPRPKQKSNSNERSKSRKNQALSKEKVYQRPKTSKSQRKDKMVQLNKVK
jgi:hypothetical protein